MLKSRPLFLIVVTLCMLMVVVASYWVALLPQRSLSNLKAEMLEASGTVLDAKLARLDVGNGFGVFLEDVTVSNTAASPWQLSAKSIALPGMLGGNIVLDKAVLDVDVASLSSGTLRFPDRMTIRDGVLKLRDPVRQSVVAITDINGEILNDGKKGLLGQLAMVWGSQVSDLSFVIEDLERFSTSGSPMDLTLKSKNMVFGFSGQGRTENGLTLVGQATAEASDIGSFFRWLGVPVQLLEGVGAVSLQSGLSSDGLALTFGTLTGDVGGGAFKGNIVLAAGPDRAKLSGALNLSALSLWGPKTGTSILAQPWSEKPLPVSDLSIVDLDLKLTTDQLKLRQRDFGAITAQLKSSVGQITIILPEQKIGGGTGNLKLTLAKSGAGLKMETAIDLKSASAQTALGGFMDFQSLEGVLNLNAQVHGSGRSMAGLVSTLAGQVKLSSPDATVLKVNLLPPLIKPQNGWSPQDKLQTENVVYDFDFSILEGIASIRSGSINFNGITLKPKGEIDVLRQAVNVQLSPRGKNTDSKMWVTGQWSTPVFSASEVPKEKAAMTPPAN